MNEATLGDTSAWAGMAMLGKTSMALILIIGMILLCGYLLKRFNPQRALHGQPLRVIASTAVGQRERVVIVEVENTWLVLGVASGQVSKLHELPQPPRAPEPAPGADNESFASRFSRYLRHPQTAARQHTGNQS